MNDPCYWVGMDIGGTSIKIALVDELGQISNLFRIPTKEIDHSVNDFLSVLTDKVLEIMALSPTPVCGMGISQPGFQMEDKSGTLYSVNIPLINGLNTKAYFEETTRLKTIVTNDLVAHGLAEHRFGAGKNVNNFLSVSMGTGIGHTFIKDGNPVLATNGISGDSGRMILDPNSDLVESSGIFGTAEALCGVNAIEILAKQTYPENQNYLAHEIISLAKGGKDHLARKIMITIGHRLALYLFNLSIVYFPDVISITGGQTEAGDFFIEECRREFERLGGDFLLNCYSSMGRTNNIKIVKSDSGGLTGLQGSIVPFLER